MAVTIKIGDGSCLGTKSCRSSFNDLYPVIGITTVRNQCFLFKTYFFKVVRIAGMHIEITLLEGVKMSKLQLGFGTFGF